MSATLLQPEERSVDSDLQTDTVWLLGVQRKLYQWSQQNPGEAYRELWNWMTAIRSLRCAGDRVARNNGKRTPGIDGMTVGSIRQQQGAGAYLGELHRALRRGAYGPRPCGRKLIPKPGTPGQFRPLGIPTVTDRVVQAAIKQFLEPILEAPFGLSRTDSVRVEAATVHSRIFARTRDVLWPPALDTILHTRLLRRALPADIPHGLGVGGFVRASPR